MRRKTYLLAISISIICQFSFGQTELLKQYKFHRLNERDGLTNNVINDIVQDTLGFVWVGTEDGLFRFNGRQFEAFRHGPDSSRSIPNNNVKSLFVDQTNTLWVLTDFGIGKYDYQSDRIESIFPHQITQHEGQKSYNAMVETAEGVKYMGSYGGGVVVCKNGEFLSLDYANQPENVDLNYLNIIDMALVNDHLWVCSQEKGIFNVDLKTSIVKHISPSTLGFDSGTTLSSIYIDALDNIWIGSSQGVYIFKAGSLDWINLNTQGDPAIPDNDVLTIREGSSGEIWVGTRNAGFFLIHNDHATIDTRNFRVEHFGPSLSSHSVSHRTISTIFQDRSDNVWLGTHNNGLNVFNPNGERIYNINRERGVKNTLSHQSVWGINEMSNGNILIGTDGGGLNLFNHKNGQLSKIAGTAQSDIRLSDDAILTIAVVNNETWWLGTYNGAINIINPLNNSVQIIDDKEIASEDVRVIKAIENKIWIGTNRGGLHYFDKHTGKLHAVESTAEMDIRGIVMDSSEPYLWLATYGDGLVSLHVETLELSYYNWYGDGPDYTPIAVSVLEIDNHIWIGTKQSGVVIFDKHTKKFDVLDESNGLSNSTARSIVYDGNGHVWVSTNLGISAIDLKTYSIANFDSNDGLSAGQYNDGSGFLSKHGYLAFGGIYGMDLFYPEDLLNEQKLPKVTFTDIIQNNQLVKPGEHDGIIASSLPVAKKIVFAPDLDVFTIKFGVLEFPNSRGWTYEYMLPDYDKSWNTSKDIGEATYRNVPPGTYLFQVRVVDNSNGAKGAINSISIVVTPPWYRTAYAYVAFAIIVLVILWWLYKQNNERIAMKQTIFYEQKLRQQEHDTMQEKLRFYTNFSHELRTPITLILGPVNDLLRNDEISSLHKKTLKLVKRNSQTLLRLINRLLEFRKLETENTMLNVGHHDLTILAQEEAESFSYLAKERGIKFGFYCETDLHAWIDIEKIQIIINNLLSNALKYSEEGGKVTFEVFQQSAQLLITVKDEGRGISKDEQEQIFAPFYQANNSLGTGGTGIGLSLCKSFVELHGGEIELESELSAGAKFIVRIPEGKAHFEQKENVRFIEVKQGEIDERIDPAKEEFKEEDFENLESEKVMMVVDDNRDIRNYVGSLFQSSFRIVGAKDGVEALELAKESVPDVIISDVMMPEMDGMEFCQHIKGNVATSHIPVILVTAKGANEAKKDGYDMGADAYITKPFDSEVLISRVTNLLQSRDMLRELHDSGQWMENKDVPSSEIEFMKKVEATVLEIVPTGDLSVIQLCRELGFSRTSLYRKIKSLTGQSIKQFIRSIKLKKAAEMLAAEEVSVSQVAFSLDFTDLKYFRTCFKKQYGMLPSEYQNSMKSGEPVDQEEIKKALNI